VRETDIQLGDRTVHAYDTGAGDLTVLWHHGTPNIGSPPAPLFGVSERLGIRWISYDRPGYGGSTPRPGRSVATAAEDAAAVADALGVDRFALLGHSGGGPHALACAALLPDRALAVVSGAGLAPYGAAGLDWFAGMAAPAGLRAAAAGRAAKEAYEAGPAQPEGEVFTPGDMAALGGDWSWFLSVVNPAVADGPGPLIDDDLAYVAPWGFDPASIRVPTLIVHGTADAMVPPAHGSWLAGHVPGAELRLAEGDGHVSVLASCGGAALEWLARQAG
jgi:pimeloyl-ACP methyl ester carboxylesterase